MEAKKYDQNKVRMDLVPLSVMESLGQILTMGAQKYGENQWQNLPDFWKRYKAALLRHLTAIDKGELIDPESGLPHIDHVLCNAAFLSWGYHHGKAISIAEKDVDENPIDSAMKTLTGTTSKEIEEQRQTEINNKIYKANELFALVHEYNCFAKYEISIMYTAWDTFQVHYHNSDNLTEIIKTEEFGSINEIYIYLDEELSEMKYSKELNDTKRSLKELNLCRNVELKDNLLADTLDESSN